MTGNARPPRIGFREQLEDINSNAFGIYLCGMLFTRIATGMWFGPGSALAAIIVLLLVFLYFNWHDPLLLAKRALVILVFLYLVQVHLIEPGNFLLNGFSGPNWGHLFALWVGTNGSTLIAGRRNAVNHETAACFPGSVTRGTAARKLIRLASSRGK